MISSRSQEGDEKRLLCEKRQPKEVKKMGRKDKLVSVLDFLNELVTVADGGIKNEDIDLFLARVIEEIQSTRHRLEFMERIRDILKTRNL